MDRDGVEVHKRSKEKKRGQYSTILTEQTWSIKDLLSGFWLNIFRGTRRVVLSGQDSPILPARVAYHSVGFDSSSVPAAYGVSIERRKKGRRVFVDLDFRPNERSTFTCKNMFCLI